jgi:hypothetical protein
MNNKLALSGQRLEEWRKMSRKARSTTVIVEDEEEEEREKRSYTDASIAIILWTGLNKSHIQVEPEQTCVYVQDIFLEFL